MKVTTDLNTLKAAITQTLPAVRKPGQRDPESPLDNILLKVTPQGAELVGCNGNVLHRAPLTGAVTDGEGVALITPEQFTAIKKARVRKDESIPVELNTEAGTITINGKTTPGTFDTESTYLDIEKVYPQASESIRVTMPTAELLQAVKTARVIVNGRDLPKNSKTDQITLHLNGGLIVHAKHEDIGESWNVVPGAVVKNTLDADRVNMVSGKYMLDACKAAGESITLTFYGATHRNAAHPNGYRNYENPILFESDGISGLIMPLQPKQGTPAPLTESDIPAPDKYDTAGVYVFPHGMYTNRHPAPQTLPGGVPSWYERPEPKHEDRPPSWIHGPIRMDSPNPQPGAVNYDLAGMDVYPASNIMALRVTNPQPDPDAPIPVELYESATA